MKAQKRNAAVERSLAKVGDHWEPKAKKGPSDKKAVGKDELLDVARRLDISGRSKMTKKELADAIQKADRKASRK